MKACRTASCSATTAQVCVRTRHASGVRGTATGYLRAFDRLFNLIITDVRLNRSFPFYAHSTSLPAHSLQDPPCGHDQAEEHYSVMLRCTRAWVDDSGRERTRHGTRLNCCMQPCLSRPLHSRAFPLRSECKREYRRRHLAQVFVRGESVVLISIIRPAALPS